MNTPAHKGNTEPFGNLDNVGRARSINAMINNLFRAINHHIGKSTNANELKKKYAKRFRDFADLLDPKPKI